MEDFMIFRERQLYWDSAFIFPLGIGIWTNQYLLGYGLMTSILSASMYASHTLIAYPIVIRYGINRQRAVSIAVGGTRGYRYVDFVGLGCNRKGMYNESGDLLFIVWLVLKVLVLTLIIMYSFPRIGRWFFRRYTDFVVQYIFVLAMVFLGAGLMEFIGMEGILVAFLAGLV